MLRKDVKLGFAIGGILLAVVIVYVLVVPSGDKKGVGLVTDDSQSTAKTDATPSDLKAPDPEIADSHNAPPNTPPVDSSKAENATPATMPSGVASGSIGPDWNKLLSDGAASPPMMSSTPSMEDKRAPAPDAAAPDAAAINAADKTSPDSPAPTPAPALDKPTPDLSVDMASTPATQPADSAQRTHIVQPGETLTSIAATAYGDARKWKRIAAANSSVNPNRLTPGTKLVMPVISSSLKSSVGSSGNGESGTGTATVQIDPQTQYQVVANDSLYRISVKLYGKADHVDKLYDDNKSLIGPDPRRLKLNMVLKLSDAPTSTLTTASR